MGELENKVGQCCDMLGRHGHGSHELTPFIATCSRPAQGQETILASILAGNISWPPWLQVKDRQTDRQEGREANILESVGRGKREEFGIQSNTSFACMRLSKNN